MRGQAAAVFPEHGRPGEGRMSRTVLWTGACLLVLWTALAACRQGWAEPVPALDLTAEERRFLDEHKVLRVAVSTTPPFQRVSTENGVPRYTGVSADYLSLLQEMLGVVFTPRFGISFTRALELAQTGEVDLFACISDTPQRRAFLTFTKPYVAFPYVLVCRRDGNLATGISALRGKTLAVAPAYYAYYRVQREYPELGVHFLLEETGAKALEAVSKGAADAVILNLAMATFLINTLGLDNLRVAAPLAWEPNALCMASPNPVLAAIVQKALDAIPLEKKSALLAPWLEAAPPPSVGYDIRLLPTLLAVALAAVIGLACWWRRRRSFEVARGKNMEQELTSQRELLEAVFNATTDAILVLDDTLHALMVNSNATRCFGMDVEAMLGRGVLELTDAPVASRCRERYREALTTGKPLRFTDKRAGRTFDHIVHPVPAGAGGRMILAIYARDITEQLAAGEAIKESQEWLAKIFRLFPAVITVTSQPEEHFLDVNEAFTAITGFTREDVLGRTTQEIGIWLNPADVDQIDRTIKRDGVIQDYEMALRLKDGRMATGLLYSTRLEAHGRPCLLSVVVDITSRKAMEKALLLAKESAESANLAKSRFLSTMSHEIRTPMNTILGMVDVLRGTPLTTRQQEFLRTLELSGEALMALLTDILELSKIESGALNVVFAAYDPAALVRQVADMVAQQAASKHLALSIAVADDVGAVAYSDAAKLRQILVNLVSNAVKFTPAGEIHLRVSRLPARIAREELLYAVSDTGIGIPSDKQQVIFEPFTQVDSSTTRAYGGSGLGLAISTLLAESVGGRLWVESNPGEGSTFYCAVPLDGRRIREVASEAVPESSRTAADEDMPLPQGRSLLIVEDTESNRVLYEIFLEDLPLSLAFAETGNKALALFDARSFDAIIMDIQLPDIDGLTVIREIRRRETEDGHVPTPILVVTAYAFREERKHAFQAGCDDMLTKPLQKRPFLASLSRLLNRSAAGPAHDAPPA
jgi:PAS domain S-box-containing protein